MIKFKFSKLLLDIWVIIGSAISYLNFFFFRKLHINKLRTLEQRKELRKVSKSNF